MKILNQQILKPFWKHYPDSEQAVKAWLYEARKGNWSNDDEVLKAFSGSKCFQEGVICFELVKDYYYLTAAFKAMTQTFLIKYAASVYETGGKNLSPSSSTHEEAKQCI
jgi:mRNA-degrading endonuclease HigB of HigAB toxin-antitoxin module